MTTETLAAPARWDAGYEWRATALLALAFGLVGLDRGVLSPLFAAGMGADLHLTNTHLGMLNGVLGFTWGLSALLFGGVSDRMGRRRVLAPAIVLFSLFSMLSGVVGGFAGLMAVRALMGFSEGPVASVGNAAVVEASHPSRRGLNNGVFQFGIGAGMGVLAPILATQLLQLMGWRHVFVIAGVPGLIVAGLAWLTVREAPHRSGPAAAEAPPALASLFRHRNVVLSMLGLVCAMIGIDVCGAMLPSYLTHDLGFSPQRMGVLMSAIGVGSIVGQFCLPAVSDLIGRRTSALLAFALAPVALWLFIHTGGANPSLLYGLLVGVGAGYTGALALIAGTIAPEAAPVGLISTAIGVSVGAGEIFGGGLAPSLAGYIADAWGLQSTLWFAMSGGVLGIVVSLFFRETAPRRAKMAAA